MSSLKLYNYQIAYHFYYKYAESHQMLLVGDCYPQKRLGMYYQNHLDLSHEKPHPGKKTGCLK